MPVIAEQHDADFRRVDIEGDAEQAAGKRDQFLEADAGQAGNLGDPGGCADDPADFPGEQLGGEGLPCPAQAGKGPVDDGLQGHWLAIAGRLFSSEFR